jgi:hypothetical protein
MPQNSGTDLSGTQVLVPLDEGFDFDPCANAVNVWDCLTAEQQDSVRTGSGAVSIIKTLNTLTAYAIQEHRPLHLSKGTWTINANGLRDDHGVPIDEIWTIDVPTGQFFLICGDGDETVVKRKSPSIEFHPPDPVQTDEFSEETIGFAPTEVVGHAGGSTSSLPVVLKNSFVVRIITQEGSRVTFHNLRFDDNEQAFPMVAGYSVKADGVRKSWSIDKSKFLGPNGPIAHRLSVQHLGQEVIWPSERYSTEGSDIIAYTFDEPPPAGAVVRLSPMSNGGAFEHCALIGFVHGDRFKKEIMGAIMLDHVRLSNCIANGLWINIPMRNMVVRHSKSDGRTRRVRNDITLSRKVLELVWIEDFQGDGIEAEDFEAVPGQRVVLRDVELQGTLDLAALSGDPTDLSKFFSEAFVNLDAENVINHARVGIGSAITNFNRMKGELRNCHLARISRIQECHLRFKGGSITVAPVLVAGSTPGNPLYTAIPVNVWHNNARQDQDLLVEFDQVAFKLDPKINQGQDNYYLNVPGRTGFADQVTRVINCSNEPGLDHFAHCNRCGTMQFEGGTLGGGRTVLWIRHGGGQFITNVVVNDPQLWTAPIFRIDQSLSGPVIIKMAGVFSIQGSVPTANRVWALEPGAVSPATGNPSLTWLGGFRVRTEGLPATWSPDGVLPGLPGMQVAVPQDAVTDKLWVYKSDTHRYGEKSYDPLPPPQP